MYYLKKNGVEVISRERHAPYAGDPCFWLLPALPLLSHFPSLRKPLHSAESISWPGLAPGRGAAYTTGMHLAIAPGRISAVDFPLRGWCAFREAEMGISPALGGSANLEEGSSGFLEVLMLHCYTSLCFSIWKHFHNVLGLGQLQLFGSIKAGLDICPLVSQPSKKILSGLHTRVRRQLSRHLRWNFGTGTLEANYEQAVALWGCSATGTAMPWRETNTLIASVICETKPQP